MQKLGWQKHTWGRELIFALLIWTLPTLEAVSHGQEMTHEPSWDKEFCLATTNLVPAWPQSVSYNQFTNPSLHTIGATASVAH